MAEKQVSVIDQIMGLEPDKIVEILTNDDDNYIEAAGKNQDEYDGKHEILKKEDKEVGEGARKKTVKTAKLITTFQRLITNLAVAFLVGRPVKYILTSDGNTEDAFQSILSVLTGNKMQYVDRQLARATMIETRAAELWYAKNDTFNADKPLKPGDAGYIPSKIGIILLSLGTGFQIFPHFDQFGDMDAFTTKYEIEIYNTTAKKIEKEIRVDIYTADKFINIKKTSTKWERLLDRENLFGKIPIIYYTQKTAEWKDVQSLIDRYENHISNHADENDYYAAPMIKIKGKLIEMPEKTESGKILQFDGVPSPDAKRTEYGDAEYMTWDQEPESLKLEGNNLKDLIYTLTSTPDVSFSAVKGISALSGIALKLLFFDATLKSMNHQEVFGAGFQRRINLLKSILSVTEVATAEKMNEIEATPKFQDPTPQDIAENIATLSEALGGEPVMSEKTALANNLLVQDVKQEEEQMQEDRARKTETSGFEAGSFNFT